METITLMLPILLLVGIFAIAAFIIVAIIKIPDNPNLRDASTGERILLTLVGFFAPVVGFILFFVWRKSRPELAIPIASGLKAYLILSVALYVLAILVYGIEAMIVG